MTAPVQYFRAGTGAVLINERGLVLAFERRDVPGAWQFPQGGLEREEDPLDGVLRELVEETGISRGDLRLIDSHPQPLVYELPPELRSEKTGRGQVQYWFLFLFRGDDTSISVDAGGEFRSWQWMRFADLAATTVEFRQPVYRSLAERFHKHLR